MKLTSLHFLPHPRQPNAVAVTASHGPATLADFPISATYIAKVDYLDRKAHWHILQLEKEAEAKIQRQAEEALAAAHQWQSTVTAPEFEAKLVKEDPIWVKSQLDNLEEAINHMQLSVQFHWVRKFAQLSLVVVISTDTLDLIH